MPLQIVRNDITKMHVDAIVNAANNSLLGGGGVDGAIHRAAGPGLLAECRTLGGCETGDAKVTGSYDLSCNWIIHTVGPVWQGGTHREAEMLASCYRRSLEIAVEKNCESVAFPLISTGVYGYPMREAIHIAEQTIVEFLASYAPDMLVYLVVFGKDAFSVSEERFSEIRSYIDDHYAETHQDSASIMENRQRMAFSAGLLGGAAQSKQKMPNMFFGPAAASAVPSDLQQALKQMDESFSEMLLRKITESGMTDAECYKKANIDRKLFSKIRSDKFYRPKKTTVIAFAVALELDLAETKDMLTKAGFSLSHSNQFDIIVEYFISKGIYDVYEINDALFAFDQSLIGC